MKLVVLITGRTDEALNVAQAWQQAGATGVTIVEGYGLRTLQDGIRDDLPLMPSLSSLLRQKEVSAVILLTAVHDELVSELHQATNGILGDITLPNNGIIMSFDIANLIGLRQPSESE